MSKTDRYIISFYIQLVNDVLKDERISREFLLEPSNSVLDALYEEFLGSVKQCATFSHMMELSEVDKEIRENDDADSEIEEKVREQIAKMIREATTYMMFYYNDEYEDTVNKILSTPISDLIDEFFAKSLFSGFIFKMYIRYLVDRHFCVITVSDEENLEEIYPWLGKLEVNRGFMSLNDKARWALRKVVESYVNFDVSPFEIVDLIDDYFNDYQSLGIGKEFALEFASKPQSIRAFKKYQLGLMISDVYRSLKGNALMDGIVDDEKNDESNKNDLMDILENYLEYGDDGFLSSRDLRYELYKQFYLISTCDFIVPDLNDELENASCSYIIRPHNPIYFLD